MSISGFDNALYLPKISSWGGLAGGNWVQDTKELSVLFLQVLQQFQDEMLQLKIVGREFVYPEKSFCNIR